MANIALTTADRVEVVETVIQDTQTAAEAITAGAPVRYDTTTGKFTNANGTSAPEARAYGIATRTVASGMPVTAIRKGVFDGFALTGLDYDAALYLSDTDGRVGDTAGTVTLALGRVIPARAELLGVAAAKLFFVDL